MGNLGRFWNVSDSSLGVWHHDYVLIDIRGVSRPITNREIDRCGIQGTRVVAPIALRRIRVRYFEAGIYTYLSKR